MSKFVGTGPSSYKKKGFTGPRSHKGWETLPYSNMVTVTVNDKWETIRKESIVAYYKMMASQTFWRNYAKQQT